MVGLLADTRILLVERRCRVCGSVSDGQGSGQCTGTLLSPQMATTGQAVNHAKYILPIVVQSNYTQLLLLMKQWETIVYCAFYFIYGEKHRSSKCRYKTAPIYANCINQNGQ